MSVELKEKITQRLLSDPKYVLHLKDLLTKKCVGCEAAPAGGVSVYIPALDAEMEIADAVEGKFFVCFPLCQQCNDDPIKQESAHLRVEEQLVQRRRSFN